MSVILNALHERTERVDVLHPALPGLQAWRVGNRVGESPTWDARTQTLLWIDIRAPAVLRLDPATDRLTRWVLPEVVGALGLAAADGTVVLALRRSVALLELGTGRLLHLHDVPDEPEHNRLNDGKVSPSGRWFVVGSMDDRAPERQPTGAVYCIGVGAGGSVRRLHGGFSVANGIAFSPDVRTLYVSDSHAGRVWQAPWDEATGSAGPLEPFCSADDAAGRPDGAAVDCHGNYWSAGVSAGCLNRFSAAGELQARLALPCRAPTMPCFGGPGLDCLFVTSLVRPGWSVGEGSPDGALLSWPAGVVGLPAARWMQADSSTP